MLIQFSFSNFRSFRDEAILDLSATKIQELGTHVIDATCGERVLPVAAIYGANASGKSNVFKAFKYMQDYVLKSANWVEDSNRKANEWTFRKPTPFVFDSKSANQPSTFEVFFSLNNSALSDKQNSRVYRYGFEVNVKGVVKEWLYSKAKTSREFKKILSLENGVIDLPGIESRSRENIETIISKKSGRALLLSVGALVEEATLKLVWNWFYDIPMLDFADAKTTEELEKAVPADFQEDNTPAMLANFLAMFDESIKGLAWSMKESADIDANREPIYEFKTNHKINDSSKLMNLPIEEESAGTLRMFSLFSPIMKVLISGSVLIIDELNARLHPLLVRKIIQLFSNPESNRRGAQLIFTTHDTWHLKGGHLRRDEIWFTQKREDQTSELYSLSDFKSEDGNKIRSDEDFEKNYLLGKYGAIPKMRSFRPER